MFGKDNDNGEGSEKNRENKGNYKPLRDVTALTCGSSEANADDEPDANGEVWRGMAWLCRAFNGWRLNNGDNKGRWL